MLECIEAMQQQQPASSQQQAASTLPCFPPVCLSCPPLRGQTPPLLRSAEAMSSSKVAKAGYARVELDDVELSSSPDRPRISGGEAGAGLLSRLTFWWVNPAVVEGSKLDHIETDQLWELAGSERLETQQRALHGAWVSVTEAVALEELTVDAAVAASGQGASMWNMPLARAFWRVHASTYKRCCAMKFFNDFVQIGPPIILNQILQYLAAEDDEEEGSSARGFLMVLALFAVMSTKTLIENQYFFRMTRMAIQTKVSVTGMVYRKSLRLTVEAKSHHTEGEVVNMMQQDSERLMWFIPQSPQLVSGLLQISLNVMLLLYFVGISVLPGIGILILLVPMNRMLMRMQMKLRFAGQKKSDERIKLINEILKGIRVVKSYAWEVRGRRPFVCSCAAVDAPCLRRARRVVWSTPSGLPDGACR
jgi:ATP-binding cassette subfamily C (CFTR/MRP) protein 1